MNWCGSVHSGLAICQKNARIYGIDLFKLLLDHGADIDTNNHWNHGYSLLEHAIHEYS